MSKVIAVVVGGALIGGALAQDSPPPTYTWMTVGVTDGKTGERMDDKFFLGRLPREGEAVDMVFVGRDPDTQDLRFQLRVRE